MRRLEFPVNGTRTMRVHISSWTNFDSIVEFSPMSGLDGIKRNHKINSIGQNMTKDNALHRKIMVAVDDIFT